MRTLFKPNVARLLAAAFMAASLAGAQTPRQQLESKYALTKFNAEGAMVIQGVTLVLQRDGLIAGASLACGNSYADGRFSLTTLSRASCGSAPSLVSRLPIPGGARTPSAVPRRFVAGESLYVTKIDVADGVVFSLRSDLIGGLAYQAQVKFQIGTALDLVATDRVIAEAFTVLPAPGQSTSQAAPLPSAGLPPQPIAPGSPAPPPNQDALPPIPPPPPPPDTPSAQPQSVALGQTIDQVVAILGRPTLIYDGASKEIYVYRNLRLKITFRDGKVAEAR
jgi:hypothetical protein